MKKNVALIYGGRGAEHEISLLGASFVAPLISREKYDLISVLITKDGRWVLSDAFDREETSSESFAPINKGSTVGLLSEKRFLPIDIAFLLLHGDFGESGEVQGALENAGIPYVGEDLRVSSLCLDKGLTHVIAEHLGIPSARYIIAASSEDTEEIKHRAEALFGYPMFIKPTSLGSSVGAMPVMCESEFEGAFNNAASCSNKLLIEELVEIDKELEIGVLSRKGKLEFTKAGQIVPSCGFYDYFEKYGIGSKATISASADINTETEEKLLSYAKAISEFVGISSLCRMDFFLAKDGRLFFNEVNTMPGFTAGSLYAELWKKAGVSPAELIDILLCEAAL